MDQNWVTEQEQMRLFRGGENQDLALKMLMRGESNRLNTVEEGQRLLHLRLLESRLIAFNRTWSWIGRLCDFFEDYQLTVGEPKNSRKAFVEALGVELKVEEEKQKKKSQVGL